MKTGRFPLPLATEAASEGALGYARRALTEAGVADVNALLTDLGEQWLDRKKGTWPKRLVKALGRMGTTLDNALISRIVREIRESCVISNGRTLEITDRFDWEPGDFGDPDSCYWGCRWAAKPVLERTGRFFALKLFDAEGEPEARCLAVMNPLVTRRPSQARVVEEKIEGAAVLFNCYAVNGSDVSLITFARAVSALFDLPYYEKVSADNNGYTSRLVWINHRDDDSGKGYVVGPASTMDAVAADLDVDVTCSECGDLVGADGSFQDGALYCEDCDDVPRCRCCGNRERIAKCPGMGNDAYVCFDCATDRELELCVHCEEYHAGESMYHRNDDEFVCSDCYNSHVYGLCGECGIIFDPEKLETSAACGRTLCVFCIEERNLDDGECAVCGERIKFGDGHVLDGGIVLCVVCAEAQTDCCYTAGSEHFEALRGLFPNKAFAFTRGSDTSWVTARDYTTNKEERWFERPRSCDRIMLTSSLYISALNNELVCPYCAATDAAAVVKEVGDEWF